MSSTLLTMKKNYLLKVLNKINLESTSRNGLIYYLLNEDGLTQKEFSILLGKDKTTISRLISSWEKKGFVKKLNQNDKKEHESSSTEKVFLKLHSMPHQITVVRDQIFQKTYQLVN